MPVRQVARHDIDLEFAAAQVDGLSEGVSRALARVERFPQRLSGLLSTSLMVARYRCALDPHASQGPTWESIVLPMQVGSAIFAAACADEVAECRIDAQVIRIPATGPRYWTDAGTWLTAFWLAMICRDKERTDRLSRVPLDLLRASGAKFDEYIYPWVESLQMFWRREPGYFERLNTAIAGTDPEVLQLASEELVLFTLFPPMKMFSYLVEQEADQFNDALYEALELHRTFWTRNNERAKDPDGYIALAPTALACLATEMNVPVEVESDYIPKCLVSGAWIGEFPT